MSEITVGKTSGFCFGVNRAVETVNNLLSEGKKVCTLGEIIHNPYVISEFEKRGVIVVDSPSETPVGYTLVIRSHGCLKEDLEFIKKNGIEFVDATCPFVKKIHRIVEANKDNSEILLAAGSADHPEMIGIRSYFNNQSYVFKSKNDLQKIIDDIISAKKPIMMISQTTFSKKEWGDCTKLLSEGFTNISIYDTICNTTNSRQQEAEKLSKTSDLMIVVGGKKSSNTRKLYEICKKNTETILVESLENLPDINYLKYTKIGIIAGASTPMNLVEQIKTFLEGNSGGSKTSKYR